MTNVLGMGFIPSSVILHCLDMWKKFGYIPRLHIGMKLSAMKFLDPIHVEKISRKCNIDSGLIVKEVSYGSNAENRGVRAGDIIQSMN
jgi:S1-C subfamily serine protease